MKEFNRIMKLIESQDRSLSDSDKLNLMAVCLESAFDQLETHTQVRNSCADMLMHQRGIWQEREQWNARSRAHYAAMENKS